MNLIDPVEEACSRVVLGRIVPDLGGVTRQYLVSICDTRVPTVKYSKNCSCRSYDLTSPNTMTSRS